MIANWLFAAMMAWRMPANELDVVRYASIATDISHVAAEATNGQAPADTAKLSLLLLSVAFWESGFDERVDSGRLRGDHGRSWCIMQINIGHGRTRDGWTGSDLIADRKRCVRAAVQKVQQSMLACASLPEPYRLGIYVRGYCTKNDRVSEVRVMWAQRWWSKHGSDVRL